MTGVPQFLIIGAMKSGTTTLYDDLRTSGEFALSDIKEPNILATSRDAAEAIARYQRHFRGLPGRIRGEASTLYTQFPDCSNIAERAREVCGPDLRLVMVMRDPVDRILSHLRHNHAAGRIAGLDPEYLIREVPDYLIVSDYAARLRPWVDTFGRERLLCLSFRDLIRQRRETVCAVAKFLGADPALIGSRSEVSNSSTNLRSIASGPIARVTGSDFYRYTLRPLLPARLRERLKRIAAHRARPAEIDLSPETFDWLRERFASVEDEVEAVTGQRVAILHWDEAEIG